MSRREWAPLQDLLQYYEALSAAIQYYESRAHHLLYLQFPYNPGKILFSELPHLEPTNADCNKQHLTTINTAGA